MSDFFFPKPETSPTHKSDDDIRYAEGFKLVSDVLHETGDVDGMALLLSTCRNLYLTVNGLFTDIALVLGRGTNYSLCEQVIHYLKQGDTDNACRCLDEIAKLLSFYDDKTRVWANRESMWKCFFETLDGHTDAEKMRFDRMLVSAVRTEDTASDQHWHEVYYRRSTSEPADVLERLQDLVTSREKIGALVAISRAVLELTRERPLAVQLDLLDQGVKPTSIDASTLWLALGVELSARASVLQLQIVSAGAVSWPDGRGGTVIFPATLPGQPIPILGSLLDLLREMVQQEYQRLLAVFRPNVGLAPLPVPFKIDLTPPVRHFTESDGPRVCVERIREPLPTRVRVALPKLGVPISCYNRSTFRFLEQPDSRRTYSDTYRARIERTAEAAIRAAQVQRAGVIVFPEYYLPRCAVDRLAKVASEAGIVLIGGLEGSSSPDGFHSNEVIIKLPTNGALFRQGKQRPSVYEPPLTPTDDLRLFERTGIGTFGVVVCSDFLECKVIHALAEKTRELHFLFVCACNPHPSLFERLAAADAARLYSHVVIANNCVDPSSPKTASGQGTLVCSPRHDPLQSEPAPISLGLPALGGSVPELVVYELSLEDIQIDRAKPASGFLPIPASRAAAGQRIF